MNDTHDRYNLNTRPDGAPYRITQADATPATAPSAPAAPEPAADTPPNRYATGAATYCPEDNKLRLYVGRVPRAEYEALRAEGWTSTPKQDCDFVAVWTPDRHDTALRYSGGIIEDEDMDPAERAADRAERFAEYRDNRTADAHGHADTYSAGPSVHGYQSRARAVRAADRHDRHATRALDAWSKAEYWTRRTAGVIDHALHVSTPAVRMGRIKTIEADARRIEKNKKDAAIDWGVWQRIAEKTDPDKQTKLATFIAGRMGSWRNYEHPTTGKKGTLWDHLREDNPDRITGAQAAALYFAAHVNPASPEWNETASGRWAAHYALRLAYENQMLEAQGGRAAFVEMVPGGRLGGRLIAKVNKSNATGRVVSVHIVGPRVQGWVYRAKNVPGTDYALHQFNTERMAASAYTPPTPSDLDELAAFKAAAKSGKKARAAAVEVSR